MKKILLMMIALLSITNSLVFGMYGNNNDWIDFLTDGNQFRARMDQLGFVLGNDSIKGTVGFRANTGYWGSILTSSAETKLDATVSAGIGYTSDVIGIGLGYNYTYSEVYKLDVHTPVLAVNALANNLRIVVPVQVAVKDKLDNTYGNYMGISLDPQIRYYTGIDLLNQVRLIVKYGMNQTKTASETYTASSFGFDFRLYFGAMVGNVTLNPFIKVTYDTSLGAKGKSTGSYEVLSDSVVIPTTTAADLLDRETYTLSILPTLALEASSDVVSLYLEPGLGYSIYDDGRKGSKLNHSLAWSAYAELYITPVEDLEWYFEMDVNNEGGVPISFASTTGITWYLPSFGAAE
ncbi:variable surface family protein [Brachyspira hyodysenteriae]|uniref:Variable surface protein A n=2 Tax=Brachyspira hyodysenteriae TaxID=159 RepID=A0A3B6VA16_BRAHW|nr:variable surface family protein [Brachyspira hyodysenteriae]ACN83380.1 variable surface protein A [Brachyspira hyodysenteriae WA1]ANN64479.1 variable surface protein vspI [Brachyspira hyodysenteriae ATCC 27164]KLI14653.1 cell surface protein [Brachyspira hyodysenteriae]KLI18195.1 cell surface protein [Brachyspira hyodysenteriae]KLI22977.1 cell surface protein [Brachyspira hyodysenteriae]